MFLRQEWIDIRLAHGLDGTLPVKGKDLQKIWRPDTYFTNNNDYKLYEDNQLALISKFGYVYYSARWVQWVKLVKLCYTNKQTNKQRNEDTNR